MSWKNVDPKSTEGLRLWAEDMVQRVSDSGYYLIEDDEEAKKILEKILYQMHLELKEHLGRVQSGEKVDK